MNSTEDKLVNEKNVISEKQLDGEIDLDLLKINDEPSKSSMSLEEYQKHINNLFFK